MSLIIIPDDGSYSSTTYPSKNNSNKKFIIAQFVSSILLVLKYFNRKVIDVSSFKNNIFQELIVCKRVLNSVS